MKVLFLTNIPSPYRTDFFNELGKICDLTVLFELSSAKDREDRWISDNFKNFKGVFLKGIRISDDEGFCPEVIKYLSSKKYDAIIVGIYASPTGMLAIEYMRMMKIPFLISSDGGLIKNDSKLKRAIKRHFMKPAALWLSSGNETSKYLTYYGADSQKIMVYPFTSLRRTDIIDKPVNKDEKIKLREKLDLQEEKIVIGIGRFIYIKGFDVLFRAGVNLDRSVGIYIIGGEPTQEYLSMKKELNLVNIHFIGFKNKDELAEYYKAADVFVLPTRGDVWGLVINEAMAYGLPVITTNKCNAGLELVSDDTGRIIDTDNHVQLYSAINEILSLPEDQYTMMCENTLRKIRDYTIENMAKVHYDILKENIV